MKKLTEAKALPLFLKEKSITADQYYDDPSLEAEFNVWYLERLKQ